MLAASFHSLQDDWKVEIQEMFDQLRTKEKVGMRWLDVVQAVRSKRGNHWSNGWPSEMFGDTLTS